MEVMNMTQNEFQMYLATAGEPMSDPKIAQRVRTHKLTSLVSRRSSSLQRPMCARHHVSLRFGSNRQIPMSVTSTPAKVTDSVFADLNHDQGDAWRCG
eukprot:1131802-Rhodomonas_salina.1